MKNSTIMLMIITFVFLFNLIVNPNNFRHLTTDLLDIMVAIYVTGYLIIKTLEENNSKRKVKT